MRSQNPGRRTRLIRRFRAGATILGLSTCIVFLTTAVFLGSQTGLDTSQKADAAIVLGAASYIDGQLNPCLISRVEEGVELYKEGTVPILIMSGGDDEEHIGVNEAKTMQMIAIDQGVPAEHIRVEARSTSTYENIIFTQNILQSEEASSVILVTEPFHMPRARITAQKHLKIPVYVKPATESPCWEQEYWTGYFFREIVAFWFYVLTGKLW
ncbi:MAG: YdcF family protein [Patescibacteria group bacterium]